MEDELSLFCATNATQSAHDTKIRIWKSRSQCGCLDNSQSSYMITLRMLKATYICFDIFVWMTSMMAMFPSRGSMRRMLRIAALGTLD